MNIEKKGIIIGAIWGLVSIKLELFGHETVFGYYPILIYLPAKIASILGEYMIGEYPREFLIIVFLLYIFGSIFIGSFIGYLISKVIKKSLVAYKIYNIN